MKKERRNRMKVHIGDIVLINYTTFTGEQTVGLFVVVYHERYDTRTSNNITCIKISSNEYKYSVVLDPQYITCLDHLSYANCNQQFRFIEPQVLRILGTVNNYTIFELRNQIYRYTKNMVYQLESHVTHTQPNTLIWPIMD